MGTFAERLAAESLAILKGSPNGGEVVYVTAAGETLEVADGDATRGPLAEFEEKPGLDDGPYSMAQDFRPGLARWAQVRVLMAEVPQPSHRDKITRSGVVWTVQQWQAEGAMWLLWASAGERKTWPR